MCAVSHVTQLIALSCVVSLLSCSGPTSPPPDLQQPWSVDMSFDEDQAATKNPERGLYRTVDMFDIDSVAAVQNDLNDTVKGSNLVLFKYLMNNADTSGFYCATPILPDDHLSIVDTICNELRDRQMKCIFRMYYSHPDGTVNSCNTTDPETLGLVTGAMGHLDQLAAKLSAHQDVIAIVEAGIFGAWGEWNDANVALESGLVYDPPNRRTLLSKLLEVVPAGRPVVVRRPRFRREQAVGTTGAPFSTDQMARLGFHNDCYLSSVDDSGTFDDPDNLLPGLPAYDASKSDVENWRRYIRDVVGELGVPMGGETCRPSEFSGCDTALTSMADQRFTYLNNEWHYLGDGSGVIDQWSADNCLETIRTHLGYRFVVRRVAFNDQVAPGGQLGLEVDVENTGWAPLVNQRPLFVVLRGPATYSARLQAGQNTDPRSWAPGTTSQVKTTLRIPADAPEGTYSIRLYLPDPYATAVNPTWQHAAAMAAPDYCIRFSNIGTWDEANGENILVSTELAADTPGPTSATATTFEEIP